MNAFHGTVAMHEGTIAAVIAAVAGLFGVIVGGFLTWLVSKSTGRDQRRASLDSMILQMIELSMQYPYVEDEDFCKSYPNLTEEPEQRIRYDNYCCYVFNILNFTWRFCKGNPQKIRDIVIAEEIVRQHHKWWLSDPDNLGYEVAFRQWIQSVIDKLRTEEKLA